MDDEPCYQLSYTTREPRHECPLPRMGRDTYIGMHVLCSCGQVTTLAKSRGPYLGLAGPWVQRSRLVSWWLRNTRTFQVKSPRYPLPPPPSTTDRPPSSAGKS